MSKVVGPRHIGHLDFRLRTGGVEYQHVNGAEAVGDRGHKLRNLPLIGDVSGEDVGDPAVVTDGAAELECLGVVAQAIDRDGEAVLGQPPCDRAPQPRELPVTRATLSWI